jgi:cysteine desulfurase
MLPYFTEKFGNAHSADHRFGWEAETAVEAARAEIAKLIGARPSEIIFTSGATEANNLALLGLQLGKRRHVISTPIEHACVTACLTELERRGADVTFVPMEGSGRICLKRLANTIRPDTGLISVMMANHEIGTLQPISEIGALARQHGILFHTDAAQAAGKVPIDVNAMCIDLASLSAHKLHGPKGVGALYVRNRPSLTLNPLFYGGQHERGMRSGTLPVPLIVGFGVAAALAREEGLAEQARIATLRDRMLARLDRVPGVRLHGTLQFRLACNLNVGWPAVFAQDLLYVLRDEVALSTGSACSSAEHKPSPVLRALGLSTEQALGGVRIGLGRFTTETEVDSAAAAIARAVAQLSARSAGPAMV